MSLPARRISGQRQETGSEGRMARPQPHQPLAYEAITDHLVGRPVFSGHRPDPLAGGRAEKEVPQV